jgi:ribosomal protein S18 acetylase RimI-like enzyme
MLIRDMTLEDCNALQPLQNDPSLGIDPRLELGGRLTRAWVACADGSTAPVGYALGWWVVDELQLLGIGVLPGARRAGFGKRLLEHVLTATFAAGGRRVLLEVARGNAAARRLYDGAGFRVFNVRPGYYRDTGDDALEMERVAGE